MKKELLSIVMSAAPCFLLLYFSHTLITKISPCQSSILTTTASYTDICLWKSMVTLFPITLAREMSLPTHFHTSHNPQCDVLPILVGENVSFVLFNLTSKGLEISNDPDLLECFLNLPLPNGAEKNPVDLAWVLNQQNKCTELATKATKYPN
ncbi:hypothetical protein ACHAXS_001705 [Conticribra weissflogii]